MKTIRTTIRQFLPLLAISLIAPVASADIIKRSAATADLNTLNAWEGTRVPGSEDIAYWDSPVSSTAATPLGGDLSWEGIQIINPAGNAVTIGTATGPTLTLGASGITVTTTGTLGLNLYAPVILGADQTWTFTGAVNNSIGTASSVSTIVNNGHTLTIFNGNVGLYNSISGSGGLIVGGSGSSFVIGGAMTYTGTTTLNKNITIGDKTTGSISSESKVTKTTSGFVFLNIGRTDDTTFANEISGNISFRKLDASIGTTTLTGSNTYVGNTTVTAGNLSVSSIGGGIITYSNMGGKDGNVNLGGAATTGQLTYTGGGEITARRISLAGLTGGGVIDQSGTGLLKFTSNIQADGAGVKVLTLQGATLGTGELAGTIVDNTIANTTGLKKQGTGTWTLSGANTYSGGTTILGGKLILAHNSAAGSAGISVSGSSSSALEIASGVTIANNITFSSSNSASSVSRLVGGGVAYSVGTSGNLTSSFAGGQGDTTASILGGTNSQGGQATLAMSFKGASAAVNDSIRKSDVFSITGTSTDVFVLQLKVSGIDSISAIGWLDGDSWVNAVSGNTGNNASLAQKGYLGSFSAFQAEYKDFVLADYVGAYGVDLVGQTTWAVINHNSDFSVIPEPSTWALVMSAGAFLVTVGRRKGN